MIGNVEYRVIQEINEGTNSPDVDLTLSCISLAKSSINVGEYPFAAVIARNGSFFCESINKVRRNHDVNRHAEIAAISKTQTVRGANLSDCTIYSTIEPCAQCSYVIRETQIGRVVYGPKSPLMGGPSRWNILSDTDLSSMLPEVLLPAPEIVSGFLQNEVEALFQQWNRLIWHVIKARGIFRQRRWCRQRPIASPGGFMAKLTSLLRTRQIDRIRQEEPTQMVMHTSHPR